MCFFFYIHISHNVVWAGGGTFPQGPNVKVLKDNFIFKNTRTKIMTGDSDNPTVVAKEGDEGTLYIQDGTGAWYRKTDTGSSLNWQVAIFGAPGAGTDECVPRWDGTGVPLLQDSLFCVTDLGVGTGLTQLDVDNLRLDGNTLSSIDVNGNVVLDPNGTGIVSTQSNLTVNGNITVDGDIDVPAAQSLNIGATVGANNITIGAATTETIIAGDLTVNGTTTTVNSTTLNVDAAVINVNVDGTQAAADLNDAGVVVTMTDATNAALSYNSALTSRFMIGEVGSQIEVADVSSSQTFLNKELSNTAAINANLALDISTTTKSSKPCPEMTQAQRDALTAVTAGCIFNTTSGKPEFYNGSNWKTTQGIDLWATAVSYEINDVVIESDKIYRALTNHISGVFATDLGNNEWIEVSDDLNREVTSTDNAIVRWDGTSGDDVQNSTVVVSDTGSFTGVANLNLTGDIIHPNTSSDTMTIRPSTVDGSDDSNILISGGGNAGPTRGARVDIRGNESVGAGDLLLSSGDAAGSSLLFDSGGTQTGEVDSAGKWTIGESGGTETHDINGDLTISTLTQNSVLFAGASGLISEDNANFNWNDGTDVLSILGQFNVDNLRFDGNTISATNANGGITLTPNGTGDTNVSAGDLTVDVGSLGVGGAPNSNAKLDVVSTTQGGRPAPVMTEAQRDLIASPTAGLQVFNDDDDKINVYTGAVWEELASQTGNSVFVYAYSNDGKSIPNSTDTVVIYEVEDADTDAAYNNATGIFTVPVGEGGFYSAQCDSHFTTFDTTAATTIATMCLINSGGQNICHTTEAVTTSVDIFTQVKTTGVFELSAGDTLNCRLFQNSGVAQPLVANAIYNTFIVKKVNP